MTRICRADFFEELERIQQVIDLLAHGRQDALRRLAEAPPGPAQAAGLHEYRCAAACEAKAMERRQRFLAKYRPEPRDSHPDLRAAIRRGTRVPPPRTL